MEKIIGICIVGYGGFAKKQLHPRLLKIDGCEVKYLYHPNEAKSRVYGELGSSNLEAICADDSVQAFVIASPNDKHYELLHQLLQAGKHHVFVEKPIVDTLASLESLKRLAADYRKVLMVGHCQRRESAYRLAKKFLTEGRIGKAVSVDFNVSSGRVFAMSPDEWRASAEHNPLGPLAMVGSHCIDTVHYLFGTMQSVYARLENFIGRTQAPDASFVTMNLECGVTVFLQCHYNVPSEKYCRISGTEGAIYIDHGRIWLRSREEYKKRPYEPNEYQVTQVDVIEEELREFIDAIRNGTKVETGFEEGSAVIEVLDACYRSSLQNSPIQLS